jgi:RimJ/RimL family protein N-acetyltransferase
MIDDIIIGYVIADVNIYNLKKIMHIYYLFTAPLNRGRGVATTLLNLIQKYAYEQNIDTITLTFDTYNKDLTRYYMSNGFNFNPEMRSYQRHDMFVKNI